jgi:hypothetical protein
MSQENVEIVRRGYEPLVRGFSLGDFDAALFEWLDPEIDWRGPREFPDLAQSRSGTMGCANTSPSWPRQSRITG